MYRDYVVTILKQLVKYTDSKYYLDAVDEAHIEDAADEIMQLDSDVVRRNDE